MKYKPARTLVLIKEIEQKFKSINSRGVVKATGVKTQEILGEDVTGKTVWFERNGKDVNLDGNDYVLVPASSIYLIETNKTE